MEKVSPSSVLVSEDNETSGNKNGPDIESSMRTCHVTEDVSFDELGENLAKTLQIQENQNSGSCQLSGRVGACSILKVDSCKDSKSSVDSSDRILSKCATFPCSGEKAFTTVSIEGVEGIETAAAKKGSDDMCVQQECPRSISLPSPLKVVSAMKGSREKQGKPITKLNVTWAPDVYDPIPAPPTVVRIRRPRHKSESKKNGKSKQKIKPSSKGSSSSSSSSKDKKKASRKYVGSSNKCYPLPDEGSSRVAVSPCGSFDVGNSNLYCGTSFLEKSVTKMHFPVAEAS